MAGAGVRYRFGQLDAEAAVLRANDHIGDTGLRVGVGWQFNDSWHAGVVVARNDPEASAGARGRHHRRQRERTGGLPAQRAHPLDVRREPLPL